MVETAKRYGSLEHRTVPKQVEYWSQIGKLVIDNPDLPVSVIRDILIADQEAPAGEYPFGLYWIPRRWSESSTRIGAWRKPSKTVWCDGSALRDKLPASTPLEGPQSVRLLGVRNPSIDGGIFARKRFDCFQKSSLDVTFS